MKNNMTEFEFRQPFERTYDAYGNLVSAIDPEPGVVRVTQRQSNGSYEQRVYHDTLPADQEWRVVNVPLHPTGMLTPHFNVKDVRKKQ